MFVLIIQNICLCVRCVFQSMLPQSFTLCQKYHCKMCFLYLIVRKIQICWALHNHKLSIFRFFKHMNTSKMTLKHYITHYPVKIYHSAVIFTNVYPNNVEIVFLLKICRALHKNENMFVPTKLNISPWIIYIFQSKLQQSYILC